MTSLASRATGVALALALAFSAVATNTAQATEPRRHRIVVTNDYGGSLNARAQQIAAMYSRGQAVAVPSGKCMSACTMYLGLPGTCVGPTAVFGFHGPSGANGSRLTRAEFDAWSRIMALYYPPQLQSWFMRDARFRTKKLVTLTGAELIRMGVPRCS